MTIENLQIVRSAAKAVAYYVAVMLVQFFVAAYFPSGPCTPNLDVFSWLLFLPLSLVLLIITLVKVIKGRKKKYAALVVHIAGCLMVYYFF